MSDERLTYFDNGATSFPKPPEVVQAMTRYLSEVGGNYGRSSHTKAFESSSVVEECREKLAELMGIEQVENLCFSSNATHAANTILQGFCFPEEAEVLVSPMEHNAIARPLAQLEAQGRIKVKTLSASEDGRVIPELITQSLTEHTAMVIINHQSNVNGVIQPVAAIKKVLGKVPLLMDASQSLGKQPVRVDDWAIDYLIFTGHKGLLGPTGTGGLFIRDPQTIQPLLLGGTGSNSEHLAMPSVMPDRFEAGTPNIAGIYGLLAALEHPPEPGHSRDDFLRLLDEIEATDGYVVQRAVEQDAQGEVISLTHRTLDSGTLSWLLEKQFGISSRSGLHCAPLAHQHLGSYPEGTCRLSPSVYHSPDDFAYLLKALRSIALEAAA
ncbi:hypothetical protein GZ77_25535 [Endozoicomonas montiporae]|uniref:Aminotransferase class V domain-containing protein n=2 Tax=Endozoicomonas montiporae TaxID=1027273 RepID=A0A081MZ41_9GAMM|nr:aminotransferase class V-fold PLP-dependent enzyme [Endozoicomonas montiporae]AMO54938.1 class V aminotransferase [Endozoicomonas montiporae CL-33]KEQ11464.1 hypothetical protein GZ77_25535 [Endozoicomonas montiporae]